MDMKERLFLGKMDSSYVIPMTVQGWVSVRGGMGVAWRLRTMFLGGLNNYRYPEAFIEFGKLTRIAMLRDNSF